MNLDPHLSGWREELDAGISTDELYHDVLGQFGSAFAETAAGTFSETQGMGERTLKCRNLNMLCSGGMREGSQTAMEYFGVRRKIGLLGQVINIDASTN
jgi:hypothetical protein